MLNKAEWAQGGIAAVCQTEGHFPSISAAAPGYVPPTFNLYSTTHVSSPAWDYFLSSNYCSDKI